MSRVMRTKQNEQVDAVEATEVRALLAEPLSSDRKRAKDVSREVTPTARPGEGQQADKGDRRLKKRRKSELDRPMTTSRIVPLLICSIGNPGSTYANTLHSAGHTVLNRLAEQLGYGVFRKERDLGNGLVAQPAVAGGSGTWTLWQSTAYMNESGKGVKAAFTAWSKQFPVGKEGRLVVVHDELEKPLGTVTLRTAQGASAKGHNGLKSIIATMGGVPFARIGIGIGRPASRDSDDVARYVLKKMTPEEKTRVEACVAEVVKKLQQLEQLP